MKNIQVIDGADNCSYDVFAVSDEQFKVLFPEPGQDVEFISDVLQRVDPSVRGSIFREMWTKRVAKQDVHGIHGTLFYELDHKKEFYPSKREAEMVTGYPKPVMDGGGETNT